MTENLKSSDLENEVECDHITKPHSTVARVVAYGEPCPICGWRKSERGK